MAMDVLLLGLEPHVRTALRKHLATHPASKARVQSLSVEEAADLRSGRWDVVIIDSKLKSHRGLSETVKKDNLEGLKIVLTEKNELNSTIEFWGTGVYSYFLKPINRELFQLLWHNVLAQIELRQKVSRLSKQQKRQRAGVLEQQEVVKSLFTTHLKLQELNQEKTNFLARTSHELLTPLTALQGYLQLLANGKAGTINELQSRVVKSSLESCERVLRLARSLTDLVALDQSVTNLQLETRRIQECLSRSIAELNGQIKAKKLAFHVEVDEQIPPFSFDFDRMQQVFVNLLGNAVKFTPEGGTIRLSCTPHFWDRKTVREIVQVSPEVRGKTPPAGVNCVRVVVEDSGIGIPAEFLHDVFEEYSRVSTDNGTPRGFGLGLAVARRVVLAHQGKIWAESTPGRGSSFTVLFPF